MAFEVVQTIEAKGFLKTAPKPLQRIGALFRCFI